MMVAFWVFGSMKEISRTKASSEPPNSCGRVENDVIGDDKIATHLDDPFWCLLLAPEYSLCSYNAGFRVYRAVQNVYTEDMRAFWIGVFVPHADDDMGPWVSSGRDDDDVKVGRRALVSTLHAFRHESHKTHS